MRIELVWFDSMGAKSSSVLVITDDVSVLIDPGVAIMHPSFPAPDEHKRAWLREGRARIRRAAEQADVVVITHYHYDHFTDFDKQIYDGKLVLAKNPNEYINDSQRQRALRFYGNMCEAFGYRLEELLEKPVKKRWRDPYLDLKHAQSVDFGDYSERKAELLEKGREWFRRRAEKWSSYKRIPELELGAVKVKFPEGKSFRFGSTTLRFTSPMFHGIEYSRVGWVFGVIVESGGEKLLYTSDLNGPIIEDYADWIIRENPDILILDGPMTYMLGYTLNLINLRRCIENAVRIIEETDTKLIIYDHHLPREPKFKERTRSVWDAAKRAKKTLTTASEYLGMKPAVNRFLNT